MRNPGLGLLLMATCCILSILFRESTKIDHCSLVAHKIEVKGSTQFSQVTGGWIKLKGRLGRVRIEGIALYNWVN